MLHPWCRMVDYLSRRTSVPFLILGNLREVYVAVRRIRATAGQGRPRHVVVDPVGVAWEIIGSATGC